MNLQPTSSPSAGGPITDLLPASLAPDASRTAPRAALAAVIAAIEALSSALARARYAAATGRDGTAGRAAAAIRTAAAHHSAGQLVDTFFALQCARDHLEI